MVRNPAENEAFVREHWVRVWINPRTKEPRIDDTFFLSWAAAATFTAKRMEAITLAEFDIAYLEGCGISTMEQGESQKRILAREQAALVELKRGMKW